jgi:hypothetical protein
VSETTAREVAESLTEAQRRYLHALEPNHVRDDAPRWVQDVEREFQNRSFRKPLGGNSLASAGALIRRGVVKHQPAPCECGSHYASLTPLGLEVRALLQDQQNDG